MLRKVIRPKCCNYLDDARAGELKFRHFVSQLLLVRSRIQIALAEVVLEIVRDPWMTNRLRRQKRRLKKKKKKKNEPHLS